MRLLLSILVALALVPAAAPSALRARVWLADDSPVVVRGSGFHPAERVAVTVAVGKSFQKTVVATATGTFVARWNASAADCHSTYIKAVGSMGSRAVVKIAAECPPPPPDLGQ